MKQSKTEALRVLLNAHHASLQDSLEPQPSKQVDDAILAYARKESERAPVTPLFKWLLTPLNFTGNALASLTVTAFVFLAMAKLLAVPELDIGANTAERLAKSEAASPETALNRARRMAIARPQVKGYADDGLLLELSLPTVPDLIRSMEFMADDQRDEATVQLISALADINKSIELGKVQDARWRYEELRQRCYACQLPNTLEALALAKLNSPGNG